MPDRTCQNCGKQFQARQADVRRGWARFCSKSCKASHQERNTGQHAAYLHRQAERDNDSAQADAGWDEHKIWSNRHG